MATDKLKIYNGALLLCEERSIASLTVNESARRYLDEVWDDGGIQFCLEQGQWRFAMRSSKFTYDTGITPSFGYQRAFAKPDDWVNTSALCSDEYFNEPHLNYTDEAGYWYSDLDEIYVKYVSNHDNWGMNFAAWPFSFTEYVKAYFASRIVGRLAQKDTIKAGLLAKGGIRDTALDTALNRDAMAEPTKFPPRGSWVRARQNNDSNWRDGGNRNQLIG